MAVAALRVLLLLYKRAIPFVSILLFSPSLNSTLRTIVQYLQIAVINLGKGFLASLSQGEEEMQQYNLGMHK